MHPSNPSDVLDHRADVTQKRPGLDCLIVTTALADGGEPISPQFTIVSEPYEPCPPRTL